MNIIFKKILAIIFLSMFFSCQGPWDYWPEKKEVYKGVYIFGHVIADNAVQNVCFQRVLDLDENRSDNFSYYDSAKVSISGNFSGKDTVVELFAKASKPACFDGPADMIPARGEDYELNAYLWWDSSGVSAASHYQAMAKIPTSFSVKNVVAQKTLKSTLENVPEGSVRTSWNYPYDLGVYYAVPDYSPDVRGVAVFLRFDNKNGGESINNTFNQMLSDFMDDGEYILNFDYADSIQFVEFSENFNYGGINLIDSIGLMNIMFPIGNIELYFYATDQAFVDYRNTILQGLEDPRITQVSNVVGGNGYFSGFAPDTFKFEMTIADEKDYRSYVEKFVKDCRDTVWSTYTCRNLLDEICLDSNYTMKECSVSAVKNALLQGKEWDVFLPDTLASKQTFYEKGLMYYCVEKNFKSFGENSCEQFRSACISDELKNECKEALWTWCADSGWPIQNSSQCGSALVSRYRLEQLKSDVLKKAILEWCKTSSDPQCQYNI